MLLVYVEYVCHVCMLGVGVMWVGLIVVFIKPSVCAAVPVCIVFQICGVLDIGINHFNALHVLTVCSKVLN